MTITLIRCDAQGNVAQGLRLPLQFICLDCAGGRDKIRRSNSPRPWRNWQTRKIQVLVPTRCGGSTPLGRIYHPLAAKARDFFAPEFT